MYKGIQLAFISLIFISTASAESNLDSVSFATYYPAPYGVYNQMQVNKLIVGDTNNNGYLDDGDQPNNDGDIRIKVHASAPPSEIGILGEIAYASDGYLYVHDGSSWIKQGGGGWYVPNSIKITDNAHNGAFDEYIGVSGAGYQEMNKFVQDDANCGPGYHVCSGDDIAAYYQFHPQVYDALSYAWYNTGAKGEPSQVDCEGWTSSGSDVTGALWYRGIEPQHGNCAAVYPVMCCK